MSVSNYLPSTDLGCRYNYSKLSNVIYLVSEEHLKSVQIDNGEAYISGLTESPLKIDGFNIEFKEETSLDERYKFQKTLAISVNGYSTFEDFNEKYYAIIKAEDGTFYMINVDFPSKVTHTYNLSKDVNKTDFTLSSVSNFPALKLNGFNPDDTVSCKNYHINGVKDLLMLESKKANITENGVLATDTFKQVQYLGDSLSFQEAYDGEKFTTTVEFQIAFDAYKSSWHYNLLEFVMNTYATIIGIKNDTNKIYAGFDDGLQPNYSIQTSSEKNQSDIVTITLIGTSNNGLTIGNLGISVNTLKHWRYVRKVGNTKSYECVGNGYAKYLLQEECDYFGNPTGRYKVLSGYASLFHELDIIGFFENEELFYNPECLTAGGGGGDDDIITDMPDTIIFNYGTDDECNGYTNSYTYHITVNRDWTIEDLPSNITTSITGGSANTEYEITITNTASPSGGIIDNSFSIRYGYTALVINTRVIPITTSWRETPYFYCSNGNKYRCEKQVESKDGGYTYYETGITRLGQLVEEGSSFCNQSVTYRWQETNKWQCEG